MTTHVGFLIAFIALAPTVGCGEAAPPRCGSEDDPVELRVVARSPRLGEAVSNDSIEESLAVVDSPILFDLSLLGVLVEAPAHTAGYVESGRPAFSESTAGNELHFRRTVPAWSDAPGHVELEATTGWKSGAGCHYRLPRPVLAYEVDP